MKGLPRLLIPLVSIVFLVACPFESKVSLGEPVAGSLDARLVGIWADVDNDGSGYELYEIVAFNDAEYYVEKQYGGPAGFTKERFRAYLVDVGDEKFLQVQPLDEEETFIFLRYSFSERGDLTLRFVDEKSVDAKLSDDRAGLLAFFEGHLDGTALEGTIEPDLLVRYPRASEQQSR